MLFDRPILQLTGKRFTKPAFSYTFEVSSQIKLSFMKAHTLITRFSLLLGLLLLGNLGMTQDALLQGRVLDDKKGNMSFATVVLLKAQDSTMVKADYTQEDGSFQLPGLEAGEYLLQVTNIGFEPAYQSVVLAEGEKKNLASIQLEIATAQLKEVVVKTQRPLIEVKTDKTVFNVEGSINATGSSAMELLRKSPGVVVDGNDNILLQGKTGVRVYIDGKPSPLGAEALAAYLNSLQSSEINAIEIITNPSARYDAEGNAGIVNIRLKKDKRYGFNANVNLGAAYGKYPKTNNSISFNQRNKHTNFFGSYGLNVSKSEDFINLFREQSGQTFDQRSVNTRNATTHNLKIGLDWFINSQETFGILVNGNISKADWVNYSRTPIAFANTSTINQVLIADNSNDSQRDNFNFNLNYQWKDTLGRTLNLDADYGLFRSQMFSMQPNFYKDPSEQVILNERVFSTDAPTEIDIYTLKGDYEQNWGGGKLGLGFKSSLVNTNNIFDFFNVEDATPVLDIDRSNQFEFSENINALYATYKKQFGRKWNVQLGFRMEQTNSLGDLTSAKENEIDKVERHYLDFFPSGGVTFSPNRLNQWRINYSRRIDRPTYQDLNPFEFKLDELSFRRGNPFLRPQYTNSFQVSHTYKYVLNTSLSYSHTTDFFAQVSDTLGVDKNFISQRNLADRKNISLSVSYPFNIRKWWSVYANTSVYNTQYDATFEEGKSINLNATAVSFYGQNTITLPSDWKLQISGFYNSPGIWGGTYESGSIYSVDFGVQKKVFNEKATVKLTLTDIFRGMPWSGVSEFGGLLIRANGGWESRQLRFNFTYQLGNDQVKASRKRKTGLQDEAKRIGNN